MDSDEPELFTGTVLKTEPDAGAEPGLRYHLSESVRAYAIQQGTLTAGTNYTLTFNSANLTITAAPLTISADAKSKVYGTADPILTCHITSGTLAGGDTISGSMSRVAGETVGDAYCTWIRGDVCRGPGNWPRSTGGSLRAGGGPSRMLLESGTSAFCGPRLSATRTFHPRRTRLPGVGDCDTTFPRAMSAE